MKLKLRKNINKPLVFFIMITISLTLSFAILGYIYYLFPKLSEFKILEVKEENNNLYLYTTKSNNAISYDLVAYDENKNVIYKTQSKTNKIDITLLVLDYNQKVEFEVVAKNRKKEIKKSLNKFEYTNYEASFAKTKDHFVNKNEDILLYLIGISEKEKYKIEFFYKGTKILTKDVENNYVNINYSDIESFEGRITAKLYNQKNRVISVYNFYLNAPIVGNLQIISPVDNFKTIWDDVTIYYKGGTNATVLKIKIYNKKNKIIGLLSMPFKEGSITLPASYFDENEMYKIELMAIYDDYTEISKTDSITINVTNKKNVNPVYVSKNFTFIKKGSKVELLSDTPDAVIHYTLDGSNPDKNSLIYKEPLTIYNDVTIKTYATKKNMNDSEINTYDFKVKEKELVVYLSPSNQKSNKGVSRAGYTNEMEMMNKLADYLEIKLKEAGIKVYRNKSSGHINAWLAESNSKKSDFHFAIHSNASTNHNVKGMEIYVDKSTSKCLSIASNIYNNLYEIYPYREQITDRGVKYATGALGEANDSFIKCGALIEVAYHDNYEDALWIVQNMEQIAQNISESIIDFYQVNE